MDGKPDTQRHVDRGYKPNLEPVSEPVRFEPQGRRPWFRAASKRRWIITIGLIVVVLVTAISLLHVGLVSADPGSSTRSTLKMQFSTGFGTIDIWTVTSIDGTLGTGGGNLALAVLIANSLQVISSFGFVLYDGLITSLLLSNVRITELSTAAKTTNHFYRNGLRTLFGDGRYELLFLMDSSGMCHRW